MAEPVREFSTTEPAPYITIDGERYDLRVHTSTVEALDMRDVVEEYQALSEKRGADRTPEDNERIVAIMDHMMSAALTAPEEVLAKLDDIQRGAIMTLVTKEINKRRDPTRAVTEQSPDLIDSTASETG